MAEKDRPYDPAEMAAHVAEHSFATRVHEEDRFSGRDNERYGPDLDIHSRGDLGAHAEETMRAEETKAFHGQNSRDIFYDPVTNTTVVINRKDPEASTCWRDDRKEAGFEALVKRENQAREALGQPDVEIKHGGFDALYGKERGFDESPEPPPKPELGPDVGDAFESEKPPVERAEEPSEHLSMTAKGEPLLEIARSEQPALESADVPQPKVTSAVMDIFEGGLDAAEEVVTGTVKEAGGIIDAIAGSAGPASEEEYFARAVDDPEKYPPLNDEMAELIKERRQYEETARVLRSGEELSPAAQQWNFQDRMQTYVDYKKSMSM